MNFAFIRKFWKPLSVIILIVGAFLGGWKSNEVYHGYKDNLEARIEKKFEQGLSQLQAQGAKNLEDTKAILKENKAQIIEKEIPIIVEKKVYKNPSLDQEGVDALKKLKDESSKRRTN